MGTANMAEFFVVRACDLSFFEHHLYFPWLMLTLTWYYSALVVWVLDRLLAGLQEGQPASDAGPAQQDQERQGHV